MTYALLIFPWDQMNTYTLEQLKVSGMNLHRAYLPYDSGSYVDTANRPLGSILHDAVRISGLHFGLFSNITIMLIGWVALSIAPWHPYFVIAGFNNLLLIGTVFHYRAIGHRYGIDFHWLLPLLLLNPLVLFSLYTLNKEALGLFLVAGLLRYRLEGKWAGFAVMLMLALYTRNIFFFFGLLLLLLPLLYEAKLGDRLLRVRAGYLLVAFSLIVPAGLLLTNNQPFGSEFGPLDLVATHFNQQTQPLLSFAYTVNQFPFGYLIGYPIVTAINIASPALNYRYWADYLGTINLATLTLQLSSLIFVALLVFAYRGRQRLGLFAIEPLRLFFFTTLMSSVYPISQHRYLLPFYPLLVLTYLIAKRRGTRVVDRAG